MKSRVVAVVALVLIVACLGQPSEEPASPSEHPGEPSLSPVSTPSPSLSVPPSSSPPSQTPTSSPAPSFDKMDLWNLKTGPHLRGANIWQRRVYPELDGPEFMGPGPVGPPATQEDFDRLAALGCNYVNISHPGLFTETPPYRLDKSIQDNLDSLIDMIEQADMFCVISFRTGPGRSEFTFVSEDLGDWFDESYLNDSVWQDQEAQDAWVAMWEYTANRYKDNPVVAGYDLMVEPNSNETGSSYVHDYLDIWDPEEFYDTYAGTLYDWNQLYPRIIAAIRIRDDKTPILVGGNGYSGLEWLSYLKVVKDPRVVYAAHQYAPTQYAFQYGTTTCSYPGMCDINWDGQRERIDRAWLADFLSVIDTFSTENRISVAINEFGVNRWVPGAAEFIDDEMGLFEEEGVNSALWEWQVWEPFSEKVNAMNFLFGSDPENKREVDNDLLRVITSYWAYNTVRPSTFYTSENVTGFLFSQSTSSSQQRLAHVVTWFYFLDTGLDSDMVDRIAASQYDLVVLDFISSESDSTDYPMEDVIMRLHQSSRAKLVLAYIDIGEAESYRTYWQPHWHVGDPAWIVGGDPDGWEDNYPVAFWYEEWRSVWLGEDGYLQRIIDAGFDGIYLDWVEAYSDENVIARAEKEGVNPLQEMIRFINDINLFTRSKDPAFIIIGQNAAELAVYDEYLSLIDAIAQEQIWFDGGAENDPPGDCPLPLTEFDVDTDEYRSSLSRGCRDYYDSYPDGTLHTSSEEYVTFLLVAKSKGKLIFTVDYAQDPANIAWVYNTARSLGFIPFVSCRALDMWVEPVPYSPGVIVHSSHGFWMI
ncbi:MAG: endo alpha-1,4 polygalactosaminidase [Theionarchaea archaeon]|nr:endo alpha-1,4 polygalactosaminidase [Theionarchaea archaeon]